MLAQNRDLIKDGETLPIALAAPARSPLFPEIPTLRELGYDVAIDAVARRNPGLDRAANRARLTGTLALEMSDATAQAGLGDFDDARLAEIARLIAGAKGYSRRPAPAEIFDRSFLPPPDQRAGMPGGDAP
jgi:hypothetical protein